MDKIILLCLLAFIALGGCGGEKEYDSIPVGEMEWMRNNLSVFRFRNGDTLFCAQSDSDWAKAAYDTIPAYCFVPNYGDTVGLLYNYWAIADERGLAPEGWRITTNEDWCYAKKIDSLCIHNVQDIFGQNKLNIVTYGLRGGDLKFYPGGCMYWVLGDTVRIAIPVDFEIKGNEHIGFVVLENIPSPGTDRMGIFVRCVKG